MQSNLEVIKNYSLAETPAAQLVQNLIREAHQSDASDIHIEPTASQLQIRYRIDGVLKKNRNLPKRLQNALISQIKIMAHMDIAEKRLPQDGRFMINFSENFPLDLRVSSIPTLHGESLAIRILARETLILGLSELGFSHDDQMLILKILRHADGMFLVTGPTGSGKTTTLYTCLHLLNQPQKKIITIEDPIEYRLDGVNQSQVNPLAKMTFASALRAMLRQSPDTIMIGEIRDEETARIAIHASLTGHLVLSTLHTNDAASAITRLLDIGIKPFLISSSLRAIAAQRLVRKTCTECAHFYTPALAEYQSLNLDPSIQLKYGSGCPHCHHTGYRGRTGIFEILNLDDSLRALIHQKADLTRIRQTAFAAGMKTLREDGIRKIYEGITSIREVIAATLDRTGENS